MRRAQWLTWWCTLFLLTPAVAFAQASIGGVVKDTSGAILPGVVVEASSPALIEKVRSVTSDSAGVYRIIDLRPGTYTVTFTLPGFRTVRREGIELAGGNAVTVNGDMSVGAVEESITVTGETPTVDIQNTRRTSVLPAEVINALPSGRNQYQLAVLLPGAVKGSGVQDVGGTRSMQITTFSIHGSRQFDQRLMINGVTSRNLLSSAWASNFVPDMGTAAEVVIDYSSGQADTVGGGVGINVIPKEGGNNFTGSFFITGANGSMQASNIDDTLRSQGLGSPNKLKRVYDINPSLGGPLLRDKLWFFGSVRFQESSIIQAGAFANKNGGDLTKWTYEPDLSKPGEGKLTINPSLGIRLTWQATPRNKIGFSGEPQNRHWINALNTTFAPEVYPDWQFNHESLQTVYWTSPVTNKLLLEARFANHAEGFVDKYPEPGDPYRQAIPVREASTGLLYRGKGYCCLPVFFGTQNAPFTMQYSGSVSYITGSHAMKWGIQNDFGTLEQQQLDNEQGLFYTFNNGVPVSIQQHALPFTQTTHLSLDMGIYAQDKWTYKRATINAGVRLDIFKNEFPEQHLGPTPFTPTRNVTVPKTAYANLKDVTPRVGVAYDLFGDGRTSLKSNWGKYMIGLSPLTGNPLSLLAYTANRSWTPSLPVGHPNYYVPQCNLTNPAANGDCGALDNALFGQLRPSAAIDPKTITGWQNRAWNQEFSASVQHQIVPRVAVDFGYFRRWYGNFTVVDNRAVGPADFTRYSITVPTDSRLPNSGQTLSGLYELIPSKVGLVDNYTTFADNYGKMIEHWNGFDLTVQARPREGVTLQGGWNTGRTSVDNCDLRAALPEITQLAGGVAPRQGQPATIGVTSIPDSQCHVDTRFLNQFKALGTYLVPKIDVQFGVTYQATPGPEINANLAVTQALTTPSTPLPGGLRIVNVIPAGQQYEKHIQQLDLRFAKLLRFNNTRTMLSLDLANALNANYSQLITQAYGARWRYPVSIMDGRLVKLAAQFDF
jgi:hypothetical protein